MFCSAIRNILRNSQNAAKNAAITSQIRNLRGQQSAHHEVEVLTSAGITHTQNDKKTEPAESEGSKEVALDFRNREAHVPSFNLAAYVNNSSTLQQFISLGVDLHSIERRKGLGDFVLKLDFEKNVKPYITFLVDQGVSPDDFGKMFTKNPLLFKEDLDDLQTRVDYLKSKRFSDEARQRIFTQNPYWLMFSTRRVDRRLGYFQKEFKLSGHDLRLLATREPNAITYNMEHLRKSVFTLKEEMGFNAKELSALVLRMILSSDLVTFTRIWAFRMPRLSSAQNFWPPANFDCVNVMSS
ncbi:GD12179 [Drosophila simulans]|uniref:GD12179 n=1 Tax=Drosophila simulans TaxID=7240 RepID=B4QJ43_DROSI|nr:GD12179 [Drosophila simulans]